jgi:hypothetical protein
MEEQKKKKDEDIIVNGETVNKEDFDKLNNDPNCRLKQISESEYKKLDKLHG